MPIRPEHRFFYPIDWAQLSAVIRFGRAKGCCEGCGRPHGRIVYHLGDGRWWDAEAGRWRDGWGRRIRVAVEADILRRARQTRVVLAAAHRDHDTSNNADANLAAFCQRCHMIHDRPEHQRRRWRTLFRRKVSNSVECWLFRRFGADGGRGSVWFVGRFLLRLTRREGRAAGAGRGRRGRTLSA